jgi:DNA primase
LLSVNWDAVKTQVQQATDLVQLIGEQVQLRPKGKEFVGLCPFHDDHSPSMNVSPAKQIFKCFACGAGGDVFSFTMDYHKMSFREALEHLAQRANIELPRHADDGASSEASSLRQRIARANDTAVTFFARMYQHQSHGQIARDYVRQRGISDEMVQAFSIGYAPDEWDGLARTIQAKRWDQRGFDEAGLINRRSSGDGWYDRLRHRLIFPIFDATGRPIAFGGRVLPDSRRDDQSDAKYLNSPETPLFNKSATLFGLHLAKRAIIKTGTAVIVEGYTDVIAAHQGGFANVVATLGTALTRDHARALRHFAEQVVLIFDADEAGQRAADRALEVFFSEPLDVKIAVLPDGLDPADLLAASDGADRWREAISQAADATAFHFQRVRQAFDSATTMAGKQRIAEQYVQRLVQLGLRQVEPTRRGLITHEVARLLKLDAATVDRIIRQQDARQLRRHAPESDNAAVELLSGPEKAERLLIGCLLAQPGLFHEVMADGRPLCEAVLPGDMKNQAHQAIYQPIHDWLCEHDELNTAIIRQVIQTEELVRLAMSLQWEAERLSDGQASILAAQARAASATLSENQAQDEYEWRKMQLRQEPDAVATDPDVARLALAMAHASAHPSARRRPRTG